ncbi:NAD(P)/FAD-dependent oxidoreductase [Rufibacter glacialis]|uniref:NADH:ubiquinone reductase (non-electrogenic) n=1 Tax=Rufibacter glacialis TaxID=1259555 RepID=A0A5M8Q6S0_9BACT|nr:NAD(P)/FAD-dependent oxidoreductase [Rufibacter glacialis]KAA6430624.1 NAD(P)/FAD-dependent oxidoreductase [Rufibacter glacialis]GGK85241.1 NADH dehydrogenase [Rufibacter glacialis]
MVNYARIATTGQPKVVIIGGGFGGLELVKSLKNAPVQVILIDKQNYHTFQPLMYQVATAGVEPDTIIHPFRKIFEDQKNFFFRLAEVQRVDTQQQLVETSIGLIRYDYLVIATGATTNYFGDEQMEQNAIAMKSIEDAISLRNTILANFEKALQVDEEEHLNSLMDYVIVGGGATGVELAGALSELRKHVFPKDYPELDFKSMDIHLIQSGGELLKGMSPEASQKSLQFLQEMGVDVLLNRRVKSYDGYTVTLDTGETLITRTLIWAAGVTGNPVAGLSPESFIKGNRLKVDVYNRVEGYENVFALGDIAAMVTAENPQGHPMLAQPAIQQGALLGQNLVNLHEGKPLQPFIYKDQGTMATIGRNKAVADLRLFKKEFKSQGFLAWLIWMFIHLISIAGFRNRLLVMTNWFWNYFTYDSGNRLILGEKQENAPLAETITHKTVI